MKNGSWGDQLGNLHWETWSRREKKRIKREDEREPDTTVEGWKRIRKKWKRWEMRRWEKEKVCSILRQK